MRVFFRILPNLIKLFFTFLAVAFIGSAFFAILRSQKPIYRGDFILFVEGSESSSTKTSDGLESSLSYSSKHQFRSFSYSFKPLKKYFYVVVNDDSIQNFIETSQKRDLFLTFSLAAKHNLKGKISACFYEANGTLIKRASSPYRLDSTHLLSKHYPSFLSKINPEGSSWQWRKNEKYRMFFRVPHNTYKIQVVFEESR